MVEPMTEHSKDSTTRKRRRWPRRVIIVLGCFLLVVLVIWNFLPAQTINEPVILQRNAEGQFEAIAGNAQKGGFEIKAHAGTLTANSYTSSVGSTSVSEPDYFSCKSLAIINFSDHLLVSRVSEAVLNAFQKEQLFDRLEYYPVGHLPEASSQSPDMILTLALGSLNESGTINKRLNANVKAYCGTKLAQANRSKTTELIPPSVDFFHDISVNHQSTYTGVESSAARYEQHGDNIAKDIIETLLDDLNDLQEKHRILPELPKSFYPDYRSTPKFEFLNTYQAKRLTSFHGLCFHNETFWLIENVEQMDETLRNIHQELEGQGWKGEVGKLDSLKVVQQRMEKSGDILEVFSPRDFSTGLFPLTQKTPTNLYVRYREPMKRDTYHTAYEELLKDPDPNYQLLIDLRRKGSREQREEMIEMVKANTPVSPSAWLMLAEHYQKTDEKSALINALRGAYHFTYTMTEYGKLEDNIKRIAKEAELDLEELKEFSPTVFQQIGIPTLKVGDKPKTIEIREGETASFFTMNNKGDWGVVSVIFQQKLKGDDIFDVRILECQSNNSRSWSNTTFNTDTSHPYEASSYVDNLEVKVKLSKSKSGKMQVTAFLED